MIAVWFVNSKFQVLPLHSEGVEPSGTSSPAPASQASRCLSDFHGSDSLRWRRIKQLKQLRTTQREQRLWMKANHAMERWRWRVSNLELHGAWLTSRSIHSKGGTVAPSALCPRHLAQPFCPLAMAVRRRPLLQAEGSAKGGPKATFVLIPKSVAHSLPITPARFPQWLFGHGHTESAFCG